MTSNDDSDTQNQTERMLLPALTANWLTMILRQGVTLTGFMVALFELNNPRLGRGEKGRKVMEALGCLAAGILPLWRKPLISAAQLHLFQVSPYKFTASVLLASTVLLGVCLCFLIGHPIAFVLVLLLNSFLVNEIKFSEAFFGSNWLPESRYYETCEKSKNLAVFMTLVSSGLSSLFKTPWLYLVLLAAVAYLFYELSFKVDPFLEKQTKYKQMLEESEDFAPLTEWNDDRSNEFYQTIKQSSWAAWGVYMFFQYL